MNNFGFAGGAEKGCEMITVIVRFKLPTNVAAAAATDSFRDSAPKYEGLAGLVRKYYLYDAESHIGGGCYLWESRQAAERFYDGNWREMITERYSSPELDFFETSVIVDNVLGKTQADIPHQ